MHNRHPILTILSSFVAVAAVYGQLTDTANSGLNGLSSGVGGNTVSNFSPLFRPYGSSNGLDVTNAGGEFDGGVAQSAPYLSINNYGASAYNADPLATSSYSGGVMGSGGSGGCCMPAATASALAAAGSGSIGYDSGYNALPYSTMYSQNSPVYSTYGSGALPSSYQQQQLLQQASTGYYGYPQLAQLPHTANTVAPYSNNYYGGSSYGGGYQYQGSQPHSLCFPLCAGKSGYDYGSFPSPMYGSFDSNGLLNGYGTGNSFNRQPYYSRMSGSNYYGYDPSSLYGSDELARRAKGFVRVGATQRHEAAKKASTKKMARR